MDSTIYKAAVTLFVEGSNRSILSDILTVAFTASAGVFGALLGARATRKAAKEGAKTAYEVADKGAKAAMNAAERGAEAAMEAAKKGADAAIEAAKVGAEIEHNKAVQREKVQVQLIGRASLVLTYRELDAINNEFKHVYESFKDMHKIKEFDFHINHENVLNITRLDEEIGWSIVVCLRELNKYRTKYLEYNQDVPSSSRSTRYKVAQGDINSYYDTFQAEFQKIEKYYNKIKNQS